MLSERGEYYLDQCKIHHATRKTFSGNGCLKHARAIIGMAQTIGAQHAIDYGCGKGNQYAKTIELPGGAGPGTLEQALAQITPSFEVFKFDPAVPKFSTPPSAPADLVWCTDVLEHIPAEDIPFIVSELSRLALKGVFVTIGTYPAKKTLPNGENAHVTIKPVEWWEEQFKPLFVRTNQDDKFHFLMLCE